MPRTWITLAILILLLTACATPKTPPPTISSPFPATLMPTVTQTPEPSATPTPNPTDNAKATLSANATNNAAHYATSAAAMTATAFVRPTLTLTPTPISSLTNREPSFEELENFLNTDLKDFWLEGKWAVELFYEDVNGDGVTELIVLHPPEIFVLSWTGAEYVKIFYLNGGCGPRCFPSSSLKFEDWTNDGGAEIIFDNVQIWGGTGYWVYETTRFINHCTKISCETVWEKMISRTGDDYNTGSIEREQYQTKPIFEDGQPIIRAIKTGFNFYDHFYPGLTREDFEYNVLSVITSTLTLYPWDGTRFVSGEEQIVNLPYQVDFWANYQAVSSNGTQTAITLDVETQIIPNDTCTLSIAGKIINEPFPCKHDFTSLNWQDITGDGQEDVVLQLLYSDPGDVYTPWCAVQQRLLAYTWDGHTATLIADASGCVTRPEDLYGVRLEDYDGDSLPEIIAAQLDADHPERIYKFNGTEFVFWSEMPQK